MIALFYGPDSYRRDAAKRSHLEKLTKGAARELQSFDGTLDSSFFAFREFIGGSPLFRKKQLAVITGPFEYHIAEWAETLKATAGNVDLDTVITMDEKPKEKFSFLLKKPVVATFFELLKDNEWKSFVQEEAARRNVSLAPEALRALAREYEKNTWGLVTELEKLVGVGNRVVYVADLTLAPHAQDNFWGMVSQLKSGERKMRLKALEEVLAVDEPAKLFFILGAQLKGREMAVAHADLAIKSGKVDYEEALLGLFL